MPKIKAFMEKLQSYTSDKMRVFNPWGEHDPVYDLGTTAPIIRTRHLEEYLRNRLEYVEWILVAEALGYQGGKFTGIALTSERILLGHQKEVDPSFILSSSVPQRTSNPICKLLSETQRKKGFAEPTATIVWKEIIQSGIDPKKILLWNIFPFHPYYQVKEKIKNRTPDQIELEAGISYIKDLQEIWPDAKIIAIGSQSRNTLNKYFINNDHLRHPSNGGAPDFRKEFKNILTYNVS